ncbi:aspartyl-phosphate phosphatase Spo0E family protein [Domibacillus sp. A3M-37]|uniref:aspartyl-phosphate phosphatase Spo0E family protein n=1 Tax=Domibacillus TaxID=1433999 RepID=UPI0009E2323B|nr:MULTISPECIES: aspartyl-phosphate phosphatase Spo0E family protein [Domibacillus]MCP3761756.1 aspartyl-phosphate phosphatase Spo0E family protein [Domibacillus sp. A3M-37]
MNNITTSDELMKKIKTVRREMIATGTAKGLNHIETIQYSQMLDQLMNQFQSSSKF